MDCFEWELCKANLLNLDCIYIATVHSNNSFEVLYILRWILAAILVREPQHWAAAMVRRKNSLLIGRNWLVGGKRENRTKDKIKIKVMQLWRGDTQDIVKGHLIQCQLSFSKRKLWREVLCLLNPMCRFLSWMAPIQLLETLGTTNNWGFMLHRIYKYSETLWPNLHPNPKNEATSPINMAHNYHDWPVQYCYHSAVKRRWDIVITLPGRRCGHPSLWM